jgi:hypothetical protein
MIAGQMDARPDCEHDIQKKPFPRSALLRCTGTVEQRPEVLAMEDRIHRVRVVEVEMHQPQAEQPIWNEVPGATALWSSPLLPASEERCMTVPRHGSDDAATELRTHEKAKWAKEMLEAQASEFGPPPPRGTCVGSVPMEPMIMSTVSGHAFDLSSVSMLAPSAGGSVLGVLLTLVALVALALAGGYEI